MFEGLEPQQLPGAIEALLFVTDEPIDIITFSSALEVEPKQVEEALHALQKRFEQENRGIQLREVAGGWRLYTHPVFHDLIEAYVLSWDTRKLSAAALEVLAIVAYGQPISRAQISAIRGVSSDSALSTLMERGLIREAGSADTPGNPTLYATSRTFLEKFGLRAPDDLPDLEDFACDEEDARLIRERLGATQHAVERAQQTLDASEGNDSYDSFKPSSTSLSTSQNTDSSSPFDELSALGSSQPLPFDVVEKIDFDRLKFNTDDE